MTKKTILSWSTGKDSAWATYKIQRDPLVNITGMLCTVNEKFKRTAMHGVRIELLKAQSKELGVPLHIIEIPFPCSNDQYQTIMEKATAGFAEDGVESISFGDLYLEDIRQYRIDNLSGTGIEPIFPLWLKETKSLAEEMITGGLKAVITCIDPAKLDASFAGREFDYELIKDLPVGVDPCGENGEFHTFVYGGPMFSSEIPITVGETVERDSFVFADVVLST